MDAATRAELGGKLADTVLGYLTQSTGIVRKVAAYTSSPGEPDTSKLLDALVNEGIEVFLPVCEPDFALSWAAFTPGMEFQRSTLAPVMEPAGPRLGTEIFDDINTLIIPALAIDEQGLRLGQGGGYYDRFLPLIEDSPCESPPLSTKMNMFQQGLSLWLSMISRWIFCLHASGSPPDHLGLGTIDTYAQFVRVQRRWPPAPACMVP